MPARFFEQDTKAGLKHKRKLSDYLDKLVKRHVKGLKKTELVYVFCTDESLLALNRQYLKHDTYTDIITFDMSVNDQMGGEIYISAERVRENAAKFETTYTDELHRVIFHGALHLCGFKDKKKEDQQQMRAMEDKCLREYKKLLA